MSFQIFYFVCFSYIFKTNCYLKNTDIVGLGADGLILSIFWTFFLPYSDMYEFQYALLNFKVLACLKHSIIYHTDSSFLILKAFEVIEFSKPRYGGKLS